MPPSPSPSWKRTAVNAIGFQLCWFACVLGAAHGMAAAGAAFAVAMLAAHVAFSARPVQEAKLIGLACVLGFAWDSALAAAGIVRYSEGVWLSQLAPYWIVVLWAIFAGTLNLSMRWLRGRLRIAAAFGAIGGPLSFWGGVRLGAATFPDFGIAMTALCIGWALWVPLLVEAAARLDVDVSRARTRHA